MNLINEQKPETKSGPEVAIGTIPYGNKIFLDRMWMVIKPYIEELAKSAKEDPYNVYLNLLSKPEVQLYVAYSTDDEKDIENMRQDENAFIEVLIKKLNQVDPSKDFLGFMIIRFDPNASVHIWQAAIAPQYRASGLFKKALVFLEEKVKSFGVKKLTFSGSANIWGAAVKEIGFEELNTVYSKELR